MKNIIVLALFGLLVVPLHTTAAPVLPSLNTKPGPEYADSVRMFQGIPAIERAPNGRLWAAWYGGGVTEDKNNYIILDTSGDDGKTWQRALILDPDRDGPVRVFDPCLWHDPTGKLWLFWSQEKQNKERTGIQCLAINTTDSGNGKAAWSQPRQIGEGVMMNKPIVTRTGRWLLPMARWFTQGSCGVLASIDHGVTFAPQGAANIPRKEDRNADEHMLVERGDGSLWLLARTMYGIGESTSPDGGKTWSDVKPSGIPHPVTRFSIRRLTSGNLLLVRHNPPDNGKARSHLTAFLSDDDGKTWKGGLLLDERNGVSYPDFVQAPDGRLYVIYDFARTQEKEILMASFREEDVAAGKPVTADVRLRQLVNRASGKNEKDLLQGFVHPPVLFNPGKEYAPDKRNYQGIPTIERAPQGRLWAAWYAGKVWEDQYNYVVAATSGDDGKTWSDLRIVIDPDGDGPKRAADPCLWLDPAGKLWLFWWMNGDDLTATMAMTCENPDAENPRWSKPESLFPGVMLNKPTVLKNGDWLMPAAMWKRDNSARVMISKDRGKSFSLLGAANIPPARRNADEHMLVERKDGSLMMLARTGGYGIGRSLSKDGGRTWTEVTDYLPDATSRFHIRRLASGNLLLIKHGPLDKRIGRSAMTAYLSEDDGETWKGGLLIDERNSVSYPDGIQAPDGTIYLIYDWERGRDKHILMAAFHEEDVLRGDSKSPDIRFRVLINQATGVNPKLKAKLAKSAKVVTVPLKTGPAPEVEFSAGQADVLVPGAKLFLDRAYGAKEVPAALRGKQFIRGNITGGRVVCRQPGVVYLITPSAGRQHDSRAADLLKRGFQQVDIPEFMLFEGHQNISSVFQKEVKKDEVLAFDKWCVLVLAGADAKASRVSSVELAASTTLPALWDPQTPFPEYDQMLDLPVVTHVQIERAQRGGYHYLHESAIAWHKGTLYAGWANHPLFEANVKDELLRGRSSSDGGLTWSPVATWVAAPLLGGESYNHPVLKEHQGKLWGFFTRWEKEQPRAEIFVLDDATQQWQPQQAHIAGFIPFTPPRQMSDGNWIIGGELCWYEAAVAISHGDDFTQWDVVQIPRPDDLKLMFPETTLFERGEELIAICRPNGAKTAPCASSKDHGRTWTKLTLSNFPLSASKPLCGRLSTGQQYLITDNLEQGRGLLSIAVTAPGGEKFCRIWKIRHQQTPLRRLLGTSNPNKTNAGHATEWSYPAAIEHDGKLYIIYTQGKEDCALSIVPLTALTTAQP